MNESRWNDVDVVVVQYGAYDVLARCLTSILRASARPGRILVVVNGMEGTTVDRARLEFPDAEFVENVENAGYPKAANQGLRLSRARFVVLLNNDVVVEEGWLEPLRQSAIDHPQAALVQPKILSLGDRGRFDYSGAAGGFMDGYGYPCARGRIFTEIEADTGQYDDPCELFWAGGAALLIDREAALEIGGFDPDFFIFHEESDLAWRLHLRGRTVWFSPRSVVYHQGSASFGASVTATELKYYMMHRNDLLMLIKNLDGRELRFRLPVRLLLEVVNCGSLLATNPRELRGVVRALLWVGTHPGFVRSMRHAAQARRSVPDTAFRHLMIRGILPLQFYLARRRRFTDYREYARSDASRGTR